MLQDLSTEAALAFNRRAEALEARNDVHYVAYASYQEKHRVLGIMHGSWDIVYAHEGENDGVVSVTSQHWVPLLRDGPREKIVRQRQFPLPADHINQIGWWNIDRLRPAGQASQAGRLASRRTHWWPFNMRKEMRAFEDAVRAAYLSMAQDAARLEEMPS